MIPPVLASVIAQAVEVIRTAAPLIALAADRASHLADRGSVQALTDVGDWELGAWLEPRRFGLGLVGETHPPTYCPTAPDRFDALLYLGPLTLTATRSRWPGPAASSSDVAGERTSGWAS